MGDLVLFLLCIIMIAYTFWDDLFTMPTGRGQDFD